MQKLSWLPFHNFKALPLAKKPSLTMCIVNTVEKQMLALKVFDLSVS